MGLARMVALELAAVDLPLRFIVDGEHYVLVERKHAERAEPPEVGFAEIEPREAGRLLASTLRHTDTQGLLRGGLGGRATERDGDLHRAFVQRVCAQLIEDPPRLVLLRRLRPVLALDFDEPDIVDLADLVPADDRPEDTWFEVRVIDEDDQPCAGIEYEVELSDGRTRRGRTNELGVLRYEGMPPGQCKVRLLRIDAPGWDRA